MIKRTSQQIADFFGMYVVKDNDRFVLSIKYPTKDKDKWEFGDFKKDWVYFGNGFFSDEKQNENLVIKPISRHTKHSLQDIADFFLGYIGKDDVCTAFFEHQPQYNFIKRKDGKEYHCLDCYPKRVGFTFEIWKEMFSDDVPFGEIVFGKKNPTLENNDVIFY